MNTPMLAPIPTNLITGFLGVGKTTAIAQLLAQRPPGEQWGVLVNEFGQVGIDGGLLDDGEVAIRQVPGGCLCCVASQAFTVGLNRLIRDHRPARLLIEPSGLGHPARVLDTLRGSRYQGVLDVRATLCLIDPRHLASERHRQHPNWQDQVALADVLVANKIDLCDQATLDAFEAFVAGQRLPKQLAVKVAHGRLDPAWLDLPAADVSAPAIAIHPAPDSGPACPADSLRPVDWSRSEGQAEGWFSVGWHLPRGRRFPARPLLELLLGLGIARIKGQLLTDRGWQVVNLSDGEGGISPGRPQSEAVLEFLHPGPLPADEIEAELRGLLR